MSDESNRQSWGAWIQGVLSVLIFTSVGLLLLYLIWKGIKTFETGLAQAIIGGSLALTGTWGASIYSGYKESKRQIEKERRESVAPAYQEFMDFFMEELATDKETDRQEMQAFFADWAPRLMVWGSDQVVNAFNDFRQFGNEDDPEDVGPEIIFAFEQLLFRVREDLGHSNSGLERGDLMGIVITDMQETLEELGN